MLNRSVIDERAIYTKRAQDYTELVKQFTDPELRDVGNYRIGDEIGAGAFGKVYLAYHKFLRVKVVLKKGERIIPSGCNDNLMREYYYMKEFSAHPNVTKMYELILTETNAYMVLEYYPEGDLFEYLTRHKRISLDESLRIFVQLASAVFYMHRNGCCHRDLKLENVLLDKKHNVKLSDFGFARECSLVQHGSRGLLTEICGTSAYMAPELLKKQPYSGIKTDIWALGVILYTLVSGEMPFDDSLSEDDLVSAILEQEPSYNDQLFGSDLVQLVKSMLTKNPDKRVSSLEEILRSNLLQPYGAQRQLELINKLIFHHDSPPEYTHSDKYMLKELASIGFDKESFKRSFYDEQMDPINGFWQLLKEKNRRKSRSKRLKNRSKSMLRLSTPKPFAEPKLTSTPEKVPPPATKLDSEPVSTLTSQTLTNKPSNGDCFQKSHRSSASEQLSVTKRNHTFSLKRLFEKIGRPKDSDSVLKLNTEPLNEPAKEQVSTRSKRSGSPKSQSSKPVSANIVVIEPQKSTPTRSGPTSPENVTKAVRPQSLISSYSVQTTYSETSNGSGYVTGNSTDTNQNATASTFMMNGHSMSHVSTSTPSARPQYSRVASDWSVNSKNVASQPASPTSSFTTLSRTNSLESSSRSVRGRPKRRKGSGLFGNSTSNNFLTKRGKSPLQSKLNAKWSFGGVQKTSKESRRGNDTKNRQQVIEEEAEDEDSQAELLNETEYADGEMEEEEELGEVDSEFERSEVHDVAERFANYKIDQPVA
ncbi:hypothetical protein OGAPHI_007221 [Ogataea philodendri]|uniref:non-specific serine/threonine protein kinase n=1 Tax=Ogataea philodendri TaxID=1378263 RepID=A0A9P8SZ45_9ASCO|nr:uncharacterized protein OGAPHI_007221 [Ogataea philodendri]KAH3660016.1 hypothetical protein OGAPHI_007221 [Ogataea philodendri]